MRTKLEWALFFAARGIPVFRVRDNGKTPKYKGWQAEATVNPDRVRELWSGNDEDANIGGYMKDLLAVDVDNKNGRDGDDTIFKLEMEGKFFTKTCGNTTPTGGLHYIYKTERPLRQGAGVFGKNSGIDTRSAGGFIVMAGSTINDARYEWTEGKMADAPEWLIDALGIKITKEKKEVDTSRLDPEQAWARALEYVEVAPVPEEGQRNDTAFKVACVFKDQGNLEPACQELMVLWNNKLDEPLEDEELDRTVSSAYENSQEGVGAKAPEVLFSHIVPVVKVEAVDTVKSPLENLNDEYSFVLTGGSHHILRETTDENGLPIVQHISEPTFHKMMAAHTITTEGKTELISQSWMSWGGRRSYQGLTYAPGMEIDIRYYNLWKGWAYAPVYDAATVSDKAMKGFQNWIEHWQQNMCGGDLELFGWCMAWLASMLQDPCQKVMVAVCAKGGKGVGKNSAIEPVLALMAQHGLLADDPRYVTSNFNSHLESVSLFVLDEALWAGSKEHEGKLKGLVTGRYHLIERKGIEPYRVPNRTRLFVMGNEKWLVPASADERRWCVLKVTNGRRKDTKFFTEMDEGMKAGGYGLLMAFLMSFDCSPYNLNIAPNTAGLVEQKVASLDTTEEFLLDCIHTGTLLYADQHVTLDKIPCVTFRRALSNYTKARNIRTRLPDERSLSQHIHKVLPSVKRKSIRYGTDMVDCYVSPGLQQLRRDWERYIGAKDGMGWDNDNDIEGDYECLM